MFQGDADPHFQIFEKCSCKKENDLFCYSRVRKQISIQAEISFLLKNIMDYFVRWWVPHY